MQALRKIGIALLVAVIAGTVIGALSRVLMRVATYVVGGEPAFSWSGTFFILLIYTVVGVPVALAAAFTTRWWRWISGAVGAAVLAVPAVSISTEELGQTPTWTVYQWVVGMTLTVVIFSTIALLPITIVRTIDLILTRAGLRRAKRTLAVTSDLANWAA